jgi:hypothetical protein
LHSAPPHRNTAAMPSTHNAEKPWDTDDIDKWKVRYYSFHTRQYLALTLCAD